jgi:hypothetical protein
LEELKRMAAKVAKQSVNRPQKVRICCLLVHAQIACPSKDTACLLIWCPRGQVENVQFRDVPVMESVYPNSTKLNQEVVHEPTGEVLKVGPGASTMQQHRLSEISHVLHIVA